MKDLKIGMDILATTTCMLDDEILKLHPTTLVDAYNINGRGLQIKLGQGHWGACPSRDRDEVFTTSNEVSKWCKKSLENHIELNKNADNVYYIKRHNNHSLVICRLKFSQKIDSLADGSYKMYRGVYSSMKVFNSRQLPKGYSHNINDAIKFFIKKSKEIVK